MDIHKELLKRNLPDTFEGIEELYSQLAQEKPTDKLIFLDYDDIVCDLIPRSKPQSVSELWNGNNIPNEGKTEYCFDVCYMDIEGRDKLALMLIANMGLERFVHHLPDESKQELKKLLDEN